MDFFEHQDRARRNSSRLVILLMLAVVTLIVSTTLVIAVAWQVYQYGNYSLQSLSRELLLSVATVVVGVVFLGWAFKAVQLRAGGKVVAERLGGRLINLKPEGLHEQRVLNVVEEMALAAGVPVPPVYLLEEPAINAFAAGLRPQNAVIGVTRGAIESSVATSCRALSLTNSVISCMATCASIPAWWRCCTAFCCSA